MDKCDKFMFVFENPYNRDYIVSKTHTKSVLEYSFALLKNNYVIVVQTLFKKVSTLPSQ